MNAKICCEDTKNPPHHRDMEESFVIILESNLAEPLVNLRSLRFHALGILLLGDDTDAVAVVAPTPSSFA